VSTTTVDYQAFRTVLPQLLAEGHRGEYALVHGGQVVQLFHDREDARRAGYERFGVEPFLLQEITDEVRPLFPVRMLKPCHS
jgi:hypothetical protein